MTTLNPLTIAHHLAQAFSGRADEADRQGELPAADMHDLKQSGYLALAIPAEYGGLDLNLRECVAAQLELAQGSTSSALVAGMHLHVTAHEREVRQWRPEMYEKIAHEVVAAGALVNNLASEPALGSPSRGGQFQTTAELNPAGTHWLVNGRKTWATGCTFLDYFLVKLSAAGQNGLLAIPHHTPGLTIQKSWSNALSLRASDSHDVYFDQAAVPAGYLLQHGDEKSQPNLWFPMIMAATYLGAGLSARQAVIQFALERVPTALGKPIATLPAIQRQIGELDLELQAAQTYLLSVASQWTGLGNRQAMLPHITAAKLLAVNTAMRVTEKALQIAGGTSITHDLPLERFFRDARAGNMHPPAGDSGYEAIGRAAIENMKVEIGNMKGS